MSSLIDVLKEHLSADVHQAIQDNPDHPSYHAAQHMLSNVSKRYIGVPDPAKARERTGACFAALMASNVRCSDTNRRFRTIVDQPAHFRYQTHLILNEARQVLFEWFGGNLGSAPLALCCHHMSFGPGASVGPDGESLVDKLQGPRAASSRFVAETVTRVLRTHPLWASVETIRQLAYGDGDVTDAKARFTSVAKNADVDRGISIIPSDDMLLQLGTGKVLGTYLTHYGIDLVDQQQVNRQLAFLGSCGRRPYGLPAYATIDLSSASDLICIGLVRYLFPPDWYEWLSRIRTPSIEWKLPGCDAVTIELEMFSTMGNGFTFPLQTLVFSSLVLAVYRLLGIPSRVGPEAARLQAAQTDERCSYTNRWSVFGDDIIVDPAAYTTLCDVLVDLGMVPNLTKSYPIGPFRESCGHDYYDGHNIRPVFIVSLDTDADMLSAINRLCEWGCNHGIPLPRTIAWLYNRLSRSARTPVPNWEQDDAGIKCPASLIDSFLAPGFEPARVGRTLREKLGAMSTDFVYRRHATCVKKHTLRYIRHDVHSGVTYTTDSLKILSSLSGHLRNGAYSTRLRKVRYRDELVVTSYWGDFSLSLSGVSTRMVVYQYWEALMEQHLALVTRGGEYSPWLKRPRH